MIVSVRSCILIIQSSSYSLMYSDPTRFFVFAKQTQRLTLRFHHPLNCTKLKYCNKKLLMETP